LSADLDGSEEVDFVDLKDLADLWLKCCPIGWPLKERRHTKDNRLSSRAGIEDSNSLPPKIGPCKNLFEQR
jgi:hypothetical protein